MLRPAVMPSADRLALVRSPGDFFAAGHGVTRVVTEVTVRGRLTPPPVARRRAERLEAVPTRRALGDRTGLVALVGVGVEVGGSADKRTIDAVVGHMEEGRWWQAQAGCRPRRMEQRRLVEWPGEWVARRNAACTMARGCLVSIRRREERPNMRLPPSVPGSPPEDFAGH